MTDSAPNPDRAAMLRAAVLASLVGGAVAGSAAFAVLRTVAPETPSAVPPRAIVAEPAPGSATGVVDGDESARAELDALRDALDTAEAERSQLAGTVLALNRRAEALEMRLAEVIAAAPATDGPGGGNLPSGADGELVIAGEQGVEPRADGEESRDGDLDSLLAVGLDEQTAADIRRRRDEYQLARLELFDRAAREGWSGSDERLGEEIEALEASRPDLRAELGDETYDRYLFEEGSDNRVGVASVIPGSEASLAGIATGDILLSYDGSRVFRPRELQEATREGTRGEYVQASVLRDGEIVAVSVPRGPLGVTLDGVRRAPD